MQVTSQVLHLSGLYFLRTCKNIDMKTTALFQNDSQDLSTRPDVQMLLQSIHQRLDEEIKSKQELIEQQIEKIYSLEQELYEKRQLITSREEQLSACQKHREGTQQLINKLLGDIERLHQDIEWYKRTYEKRSLLGTLRQKLFSRQ